MDRNYELTILLPAQAELEEIARLHLALSGPQSARALTEAVYDALEALKQFPLSGPMVRDESLRQAGYRYVRAKKYLIFYRLVGDTVVVYHIAHGASDYPKLLKTGYL